MLPDSGTPSFRLDEDVPEGDLGAESGALADGRPYLCEMWLSEGITLCTFFLSTQGLETASAGELVVLVRPRLEAAAVAEEHRRLNEKEKLKIRDASQNEMYVSAQRTPCFGR